DLLDGHTHVAFAERASEESCVNPKEFLTSGDPLTEDVDEVAILHKVLIHSGCVVTVPPRLARGDQLTDGQVLVRLVPSVRRLSQHDRRKFPWANRDGKRCSSKYH